ncbi:MAG TPA: TetR/AcrR family transcriptional regulator, partial [Anaerolineae bacterium]|nr:TetR/AcrR family transcriptional regulator [Anaerolineae bacterium]
MSNSKLKLQQALLTLIKQEPYHEISMTALSQQAKVGRTTLYRHYTTKDEILSDCLQRLFEAVKIIPLLERAKPETAPQEGLKSLITLYTHVLTNRDFYYLLCTDPMMPRHIHRQFRRFIKGHIIQLAHDSGLIPLFPPPVEVIINYIAETHTGLIIWWLESKSEHPPERMAEISMRLIERGFLGFSNIPPLPIEIG